MIVTADTSLGVVGWIMGTPCPLAGAVPSPKTAIGCVFVESASSAV